MNKKDCCNKNKHQKECKCFRSELTEDELMGIQNKINDKLWDNYLNPKK